MTNLNFHRIKWNSILLVLPLIVSAAVLLLTHGCQKEPAQQWAYKDKPTLQASDREPFEVTISWLQTFQTDLAAAIRNSSMSQSYTTEQMAAGAEALINLATISSQARSAHRKHVTEFQVSYNVNTTNAKKLKDIYNGAYNAYRNYWLSTDTTETYPVVVEVTIRSVTASAIYVRVTSILGTCNTCLVQNYTNSSAPCDGDAFETGEAYYVGGGDEEESLISAYLLPMCNNACGTTPACGMPTSTAYEQIEARINFNYLANNPPCGPGTTFQGYINVTGPVYASGAQYEFLQEDCGIYDQYIGTCMEDELLNCAYCSFYEQIGTSPFAIPTGKQFISLNLGVNFCFCADHQCDYIAHPIAEYTYGCAVCKSKWPVWPGWHDPVTVSLSDLNIP